MIPRTIINGVTLGATRLVGTYRGHTIEISSEPSGWFARSLSSDSDQLTTARSDSAHGALVELCRKIDAAA